ncbi:MAG: hypothetical protein JXR25_04930 [Pontiellaceae bacterium]|nr:hypothetical protein [Pontiellaceae bacterium]MBN2784151.1 hypothetical protein [Pontiellaceae bacterium]
MNASGLTVFANFFIDTDERLLRMIDSFQSFQGVRPEKWVINIRGRHRKKAAWFLEMHVDEPLHLSFKESKEGWFFDTTELLDEIPTDYVLCWVEDHICVASPEYMNNVIHDMRRHNADMMCYSFHSVLMKRYAVVEMQEGGSILHFANDTENHALIAQNEPLYYFIIYPSIMKTELFRKVVLNPCSRKERRWSTATPFDFEKNIHNGLDWLPVNTCISKDELFAAIDDDRKGIYRSLQSRGLYPIREERQTYAAKK